MIHGAIIGLFMACEMWSSISCESSYGIGSCSTMIRLWANWRYKWPSASDASIIPRSSNRRSMLRFYTANYASKSTNVTYFAIRSNVTKEACVVNPGRIGITVNSGHFFVYSHYPKGKAPHNQDYRNPNTIIHGHSQWLIVMYCYVYFSLQFNRFNTY